MTAQITTLPGGTAQTAVSGTVIRTAPGTRYEIADLAPDGTASPALTAARLIVVPNVPDLGDISVTLPDGTVLVFKGMVDLFGSGSGLSAGGVPVLASLEDLAAPAAGGDIVVGTPPRRRRQLPGLQSNLARRGIPERAVASGYLATNAGPPTPGHERGARPKDRIRATAIPENAMTAWPFGPPLMPN